MNHRSVDSTLKSVDIIVYALLIVGALNWGLAGFFGYNLVAEIFGPMTAVTRTIYALVGIAALYDLLFLKAIWRRWNIHFHRPVITGT